jgi:protein-S-isoprenylcysteine O-methyltransferase Ste14
MSFEIKTPEETVKYNFYRTVFYKSIYEKTMAKNEMVHAPYISKSNEPNLIFLNQTYVCKTLYITKKIHSIKGVEYDATMTIELKSNTNQESPVYVCFPLKTGAKLQTPMDKVLEGKEDAVLILNDYITSKTAIHYENNDLVKSHVIVLTTPILVSSTFSNIREIPIYLAGYAKKYKTVSLEPILGNVVEGFKEGNTDMAGYCVPISETDPNISNNMLLQMDSNLVENNSKMSSLTTAFNFMMFFVMTLVVVFFIPSLYDMMFIQLVKDNVTFTPQSRLNRIYAIDVSISVFLFTLSIIFINFGILKNDQMYTIAGFFVFLFFVGSLIIIQYQRIMNPEKFLNKLKINPSETDARFENAETDIIGLLRGNFSMLFTKIQADKTDPSKKVHVPSFNSLLLLIFIFAAFLFLLRLAGLTDSYASIGIVSPALLALFVAWYIVALVNHVMIIYTP